MTKAELCQLFPAFSPKRAIRKLNDGEESGYEVVGKWVRVEKVGSSWDVFLCNVRDMTKGMGARKLNNLVDLLPPGIRAKAVDGEAWWFCEDVNLVRAWLEGNRVALGIAKRRPATNSLRTGGRNRPQQVEAVGQAAPARAHEAYGPPSAGPTPPASGAPMANLP